VWFQKNSIKLGGCQKIACEYKKLFMERGRNSAESPLTEKLEMDF